jgi:hypothetical protein
MSPQYEEIAHLSTGIYVQIDPAAKRKPIQIDQART